MSIRRRRTSDCRTRCQAPAVAGQAMRLAGPVRNARPSSRRTCRSPPGKRIVAGETPSAAATATALEPDDAVSPAPRSQTRASTTPSPSAAGDLHVRPVGEARVRLEQRADPRQVGRVAVDDRVRVADVDRDEPDALDLLGLSDRDEPHVLLDEAVSAEHRRHLALAHAHDDAVGARALGQPARRDPRAVARDLGLRAVRVPDRDLDPVVAACASTSRIPSASPTASRTRSAVRGSPSATR